MLPSVKFQVEVNGLTRHLKGDEKNVTIKITREERVNNLICACKFNLKHDNTKEYPEVWFTCNSFKPSSKIWVATLYKCRYETKMFFSNFVLQTRLCREGVSSVGLAWTLLQRTTSLSRRVNHQPDSPQSVILLITLASVASSTTEESPKWTRRWQRFG